MSLAVNVRQEFPAGAGTYDGIPEAEFHQLREMVRAEFGVVLAPAKRVMVETRLRKRARALGMPSLAEYCRYVRSSEGRNLEWAHLTDVITTHKTDFFREPAHFEWLIRDAAPFLASRYGAGFRRPLLVWSAACSTGEEPYTAAMVLKAYADSLRPSSFHFRVYATDISEAVIRTAQAGIYPASTASPVPEKFRRAYLLRSKDPAKDVVRIAPEIRSLVDFRTLNLLDRDYGFAGPMDVIFCRNVLIYFDRPTQQRTLESITRWLRPQGYLFMGHSESLNGLDLPVTSHAPAVYRRWDG